MDPISILVVLLVVGLVLWAVSSLPIDPTILAIIRVVAIVFVCFWLLQAFGLIGGVPVLHRR